MLGFIRRNIHSCPKLFKEVAYKSLVRPHMEYGATVWDPYTQKDTYRLEMVQRKSACFVQSDYRHRSSVIRMLGGLNWESLKDRHTICRLTMVFKILKGEVAIPSEEFFEFNCTRTRHGHPKKLTRYQPKPDVPWSMLLLHELYQSEWSTRGSSGIQVHWQLQQCHPAPPVGSISIFLVRTCVPPSAAMYREWYLADFTNRYRYFFLYFLLMIYLITYQNVKLASMQMTQLLYVLEKLLRKFRYHSNTT